MDLDAFRRRHAPGAPTIGLAGEAGSADDGEGPEGPVQEGDVVDLVLRARRNPTDGEQLCVASPCLFWRRSAPSPGALARELGFRSSLSPIGGIVKVSPTVELGSFVRAKVRLTPEGVQVYPHLVHELSIDPVEAIGMAGTSGLVLEESSKE